MKYNICNMSIEEINPDNILYFVYTDPGAMTGLSDGIVFYFDEEGILQQYEGRISDNLRKMESIFPDKFARLAAGLGNYGRVSRRAIYAGCYEDEHNHKIIKLKLDGKEYNILCYCPEAPFTNGREYPMSEYDIKTLWDEYDKHRWET